MGVVGPDLDCCRLLGWIWASQQALALLSSTKKNKKEEEPAGASPVAAPMPK